MPFPNVPNVPGVPALPRDPTALTAALILLASDAINFFVSDGSPQWGIFLDGEPVVAADSVVSFEFKQTSPVSDYPVEEGGFETYDKVQTPFDARVRFAAGGSEQNRQEFIASVAAIADTVDLYDVVTPEVIYQNVNITHYDYKRNHIQGVGLIIIDIWLIEVRVTASAQFTNTKDASGAGQVNGGTVQTSPATPTQTQTVTDAEIAGGF